MDDFDDYEVDERDIEAYEDAYAREQDEMAAMAMLAEEELAAGGQVNAGALQTPPRSAAHEGGAAAAAAYDANGAGAGAGAANAEDGAAASLAAAEAAEAELAAAVRQAFGADGGARGAAAVPMPWERKKAAPVVELTAEERAKMIARNLVKLPMRSDSSSTVPSVGGVLHQRSLTLPAQPSDDFLLSRPPQGHSDECVEITLGNSGRFYLRVDSAAIPGSAPVSHAQRQEAEAAAEAAEAATSSSRAASNRSKNLLAVPISELMAQVGLAALDQTMAAARAVLEGHGDPAAAAGAGAGVATATGAAELHSRAMDDDDEAEASKATKGAAAAVDAEEEEAAAAAAAAKAAGDAAAAANAALWVDKYAPHVFRDLMSADDINRKVVRWIKLWDARVFGGRSSSGTPGGSNSSSSTPMAKSMTPGPSSNSGSSSQREGMSAGLAGLASRGKKPGSKGGRPSSGHGHDSDADDLMDDSAGPANTTTSSTPAAATAATPGSSRGGRGGRGGWRGGRGGGGGYSGGRGGDGGDGGAPRDPLYAEFGYGWNPYAKVLLFTGPPGMGKTTLAHIAARHAGYRAVEINASDDRSGKTVRERLSAAQAMQAVFADRKPALVVLDEIDGMDGGEKGGITELVKMIKATPSLAPSRFDGDVGGAGAGGAGGSHSKNGGGDADGDDDGSDREGGSSSSGKKRQQLSGQKRKRGARDGPGDADGSGGGGGGSGKEEVQALTRPLICICNDQYAPVLRDLRQLVQVVQFGRTPQDKLVRRLREICSKEGLQVTTEALTALADLTDCDVRSCLNTLQFMRAQAGDRRGGKGGGDAALRSHRIGVEAVLRAAVGAKDQTKALHDVWSAVFSKPDLRIRNAKATIDHDSSSIMGGGQQGAVHASRAAYLQRLQADVGSHAAGEPHLLLAGLHENLINARIADPTLYHTIASLEWLCWAEDLVHRAQSHQAHALLKFIPSAAVAVHLHLASDLKAKIAWPRTDTGLRSTQEARRNVLRSFMAGRAAALASAGAAGGAGCLDARIAVLDLVSPLLSITAPSLRPVTFGLFNSKEKKDAEDLVNVSVYVVVGLCCLLLLRAHTQVFLPSLVQVLLSNGLTFAPAYDANASQKPAYFLRQDETRYALQP